MAARRKKRPLRPRVPSRVKKRTKRARSTHENELLGLALLALGLVLVGEPTFPGCRIRGRVVGVFHMADEKGPDEKILCVPLKDPAWMRVSDVHDIPAELRNEIEHFFQVYKDLEEAKVETYGYGNRAEAVRVVAEARARAAG